MFMSSNVESKKGKWAKPMDSNSTSPDHRKELSVKSKEKFKEILDLETDKNTDDTDASENCDEEKSSPAFLHYLQLKVSLMIMGS